MMSALLLPLPKDRQQKLHRDSWICKTDYARHLGRHFHLTLSAGIIAIVLVDVGDHFKTDFKKASYSRLSGSDINSDHIQVVAGRFESLHGIMVRNKSGVIIKGCIALPAETIKDDQQPSMFLVDARSHEIVTAMWWPG
jgi:hypothetical protein